MSETQQSQAEEAKLAALAAAQEVAIKNAEDAKQSAVAAAASFKQTKRIIQQPTRIAWLNLCISTVTMLAVAWQSLLTRSYVDYTRDQIRFGILQQQQVDQERIDAQLTSGAFLDLAALDPECKSAPNLPPSKQIAVNTVTQGATRYYQHYFFVMYTLSLDSEWSAMCNEAKRQIDQYCHLAENLKPLLAKSPEEFKDGFEKCELPRRSLEQWLRP